MPGLREFFVDRAKRSAVFSAAFAFNALLVLVNVFDVLDKAPAAVLVVVFAIEVLVVLPVLIAVLVLNVKDSRTRRGGEP